MIQVEEEVIDELEDSFADKWSYKDGKWSTFAKTMNFVQFEVCLITAEGVLQ